VEGPPHFAFAVVFVFVVAFVFAFSFLLSSFAESEAPALLFPLHLPSSVAAPMFQRKGLGNIP